MQFAYLYPKDIQKRFWKTISFVKNLEMTQIAGGGGHVLCAIVTQCVRKSICDSPLIKDRRSLRLLTLYCHVENNRGKETPFWNFLKTRPGSGHTYSAWQNILLRKSCGYFVKKRNENDKNTSFMIKTTKNA